MAVSHKLVPTEDLEMAVVHNQVLTEALEMAVFRNLAPMEAPAMVSCHILTLMDPVHTSQPHQVPTTSRDCIVKASPAPVEVRFQDPAHNLVHTRGVVLPADIYPFLQPSCLHQHRPPSVPLVSPFHCHSFQGLFRIREVHLFHNLLVDIRLFLFRVNFESS